MLKKRKVGVEIPLIEGYQNIDYSSTVLLPYRERPYREQIVIFREIISSRIGNKSKIRVTQASFSLNWVTICTKTWKPFFEIELKVL